MTPILDVAGYTLDYRTRARAMRVIDDVSLRIALDGQDLRGLGAKAVAAIRGRRISMVFQDPSASLNPTLTLGPQASEALCRHRGLDAKQASDTAVAALYISHDPALVARVAVLDRGRIVEQGPARRIFAAPGTDYTRRLVAAVPRPDRRLPTLMPARETLLEPDGLSVIHARRRLFGPAPEPNASDVALSLHDGEIQGLVGESGSGKSTIARAFAACPSLVICDEITAPLDVSVQAAVIDLLLELHRAHGTAYLFITHDLNLARQIAHRLAVMRAGRLVDMRRIDAIAAGVGAAYTRELIDAFPVPVGKNSDEP